MRYYFDHNACTPVDPRVLERFAKVEAACPGNPGSLHSSGRQARAVVEESRDLVAETLDVLRDSVFFVSGGTEANNTIILGAGDLGRPVLCGPVEHPSVLECAEERGVVSWRVDHTGAVVVAPPDVPVGLVALVHGQNEVGTIQPVTAALTLAGELGVPIHIDASQTLGRWPVLGLTAAANSIAFSTHKAGGLRGMSILVDKNTNTEPRLIGGGQQLARRPGTEAPGLIAASALALHLAIEEQQARAKAMRAALDAFVAEVRSATAQLLTPPDSLPNTAMFLFAIPDGRQLLPALDTAYVQASQGSACSSGSPTPPPILNAMGLSEDECRACARFTFSHHTSPRDAADGGRIVKNVVSRLHTR